MTARQLSITPRDAYFRRASRLLFWFGCRQPSGDVRNSMAGGVAAVKTPSFTDAQAWAANPGYLTTGADVNAVAILPPNSGQDFDLSAGTYVFSLRLKKATPAGNEKIINGYDAVNGGIGLTAQSNGTLQFAVKANDNTTLVLNITSAQAATLNGNEHCITFFVPQDNVSVQWYVDANRSGTSSNSGINGKLVAGGNALNIGGSTQTGSGKAAQFASVQAYLVPKALAQINAVQVHSWINNNPHLPVPDWVF